MRSWLHALVAILAPLGTSLAAPPDEAIRSTQAWMAKLAREGRAIEYQGVVVFAHDGRIETMQVSRKLGPRGPRDEIVALSGDRRTLVREQGRLTCTDQAGASVEVASGDAGLLGFEPAALIAGNEQYRLALRGQDRVAGLEATVVEARPDDDSRYGYRLWLEPNSGMVLGTKLEAPDGSTVQQLMFTSIALSRAQQFGLPVTAKSTGPAAMPGLPGDLRLGWLPRGFRVIAQPPGPGEKGHVLLSDGLAYVSVYVEPLGQLARPMRGALRRGGMNMYARPVAEQQVVVIGDVPSGTAERIAMAIEPPVQR